MARDMEYYKLLALQQARYHTVLSTYELDSDGMEKFKKLNKIKYHFHIISKLCLKMH